MPHVTPFARVIGPPPPPPPPPPPQCDSNGGFDIFFDVSLNKVSKKRHWNVVVDEDIGVSVGNYIIYSLSI